MKSLVKYLIMAMLCGYTSLREVVQKMLKDLKIEKAVFTLDALHCQTETVKAIVESGNGYVITVKRNQKNCMMR